MYVRWQYLGPSWKTIDGRVRSRRLADKQPAHGQCRYRLTVVGARRDPATRTPHVHVVQYLGVVDELALHPGSVGPAVACSNRNALLTKLAERLNRALRAGAVTQDEHATLRAAINAAFPKMRPPEGRSYVVVPARVHEKALARWELDAQAAWEQMKETVTQDLMPNLMRHALREEAAKETKGADPEEQKQREALRQVRRTMAAFGKGAKDAFWKFCAEHNVPEERRDTVWYERATP